MKQRDEKTKKLLETKKEKLEQDENLSLTLQPKLETNTTNLSLKRYNSSNDLFSALHSSKIQMEKNKKKLEDSANEEFTKECSFIPKINSNANKLSCKKRFERGKILQENSNLEEHSFEFRKNYNYQDDENYENKKVIFFLFLYFLAIIDV